MSKKVLLIKVHKDSWFSPAYGYLVASWKKADIEFELIDLYRNPTFDVNARCAKGDILAVAFGGATPLYSEFKKNTCSIKERFPNIPCILGGPILNSIPLEFMFRKIPFDYGVIGEGEITSVELIKHIADYDTPPLKYFGTSV